MVNHKILPSLLSSLFLFLSLISFALTSNVCVAQGRQAFDQRLESNVWQINVGLKLKLKNSLFVQITDLSPKEHYYVFKTSDKDMGYQVVGHGTAFRIAQRDSKSYFVTSKHVLENARQLKEECEMFYAAAQLYADRNKVNFADLLAIIKGGGGGNISSEARIQYKKAVDGVWDCYERYLSKGADPGRVLFKKYKGLVSVEAQADYFMHAPSAAACSAQEAQVYKLAKTDEPDLAILESKDIGRINNIHKEPPLALDLTPPYVGQEIYIIGYPQRKSSIKDFSLCLSKGRITKVDKANFQFDAPIAKGNSGSPAINLAGKVVGVVTVKGILLNGKVVSNCGGAINARTVRNFASQLLTDHE